MSAITEIMKTAVTRSNGNVEISPNWVEAQLGQLTEFDFIDVREPHEMVGPLGAAYGVVNIPLNTFMAQIGTRDKSRPTVIICRSGRRSSIAADAYEKAGYSCVASVEGGTLGWNHEVLGRADVHVIERNKGAASIKEAQYLTNGMGVPEVSVDWVHGHLGLFRLVDVRGAMELVRDGQVLQAVNVPLGTIGEVASDWKRDEPIVVMCRSGGRSSMAARALIGAGFSNIASMEGGMMGWAAAGLPQG